MTTALDSWTDTRPPAARQPFQLEIADLIDLSERLATVEGFVPKPLLNRPPAVLATMLAGHGLGLDPMVSLRAIFQIEGRIALSAEVARALVYAAGHSLEVVTYEDTEVSVRGKRRGEHNWTPISWTWDRAKRAGLTGKQVWSRFPRQMLAARATGELCRLKFADALAGLDVVADEEAGELVGIEPGAAPAEPPAKKTVTRRAAVKAPGLSPAPATAEAAPVPDPVAGEARETAVGDAPLGGPVPSTGEMAASPSTEPPEPEPVADVKALPQWQRKLHAQMGELFVGADQETRDAYRHAMVAVLTRGRDGGPVQSSSELTEPERAGFSAMLNFIQVGECLIARLEDGGVELRQGGWCYRVGFDPLEVKSYREAG